eukprot:s2309_g13.t1
MVVQRRSDRAVEICSMRGLKDVLGFANISSCKDMWISYRILGSHPNSSHHEQLAEILDQTAVKDYLQSMDLDVHEGRALFHILDNGDGEVTLDEFIDGIMRCKGPARAIDQVAMSADMKNLDKKVNIVIQRLGVRSGSASKSVAPTPSPRTEVLRRQKSQAAYLKPFRLDMDNEQGFLARRASVLVNLQNAVGSTGRPDVSLRGLGEGRQLDCVVSEFALCCAVVREQERLELKKALDRIECHARSLGPGGKDLPPEYRAEALPGVLQQDFAGIALAIPRTSQPDLPEMAEADPFPPAAVPEDLDDDDLVLPTDNLNWGQTRLVSNETEMSIVSTMARAAEKTKSSSPGEGSKQHVTSTSSIVEPAMALIVQQSMEVDLYQLRRRRIKDDELNSCFSSRQCILFRLLSETHHCMQDITDYVGCTLVFINYVVLLVELEVEGRQTAILLGLDDGDLALQPDTLRVVDSPKGGDWQGTTG